MRRKTIDMPDNNNNTPIIIDPKLLQQFGNREDEIDLIKLFSNLWSLKSLIIFSTLLFTLLGGLYAFLATPVYESNIYLRPPTEKDIVELKKITLYISPGNKTEYTTGSVYEKFVGMLRSNHAKRTFFQRAEIHDYYARSGSSGNIAWKNFLRGLSVNVPKVGDIANIDVSFRTTSAERSQQWLNDYIEHVFSLTKTQLLSDIKEALNSQKEQVNLQIESRFSLFNLELEKEIAKLTEALVIAKSLNLTTPVNANVFENKNSNLMVDEMRRLYKSGTKALKVEVDVLLSRKDNILFVPGVSGLLHQQKVLSSLIINEDNVQPAQIDLEAQISDKPIKPKKALILAISAVLGFMLGVLWAIICLIIRHRNQPVTTD